jgi:hypothetical protein
MLPRGIRNNNFGNIEDGPFARSQPGYVGTDGRFARFDTPDSGMNAMTSLLNSGGYKNLNTARGVISRWAPSSDGNDVNAYASYVAQGLGLGPDDPFDRSNPATLNTLARRMAQFENGEKALASAGALSPNKAPPMQPMQPQAPALSPTAVMGPGALEDQRAAFDPATTMQQAGAWLMAINDPRALNALGGLQKTNEGAYSMVSGQDGTMYRVNKKTGAIERVGNAGKSKAQEAYDIETHKGYAAENQKAYEASANLPAQRATLEQMKTLVANPEVYQGFGGEWVSTAKNMLSSLGRDPKGLDDTQLLQAMSKELTLKLREAAGGMPGSLSDKDLAFLERMSVSLNNKPEVNAQIIARMERAYQRVQDINAMREEYVSRNGRYDEGFRRELRAYNEKNPLFTKDELTPAAAAPAAATGGYKVLKVH